MRQDLADIEFSENGAVDIAQLHALYRLIGWDRTGRCTPEDTAEMLKRSQYRVAAHSTDRRLVGFARICGDPYVVQVLDVITHPDFRHRGIATRCMEHVLAHLRGSRYVSVILTSVGNLETFYQQFGFRMHREAAMEWDRPR